MNLGVATGDCDLPSIPAMPDDDDGTFTDALLFAVVPFSTFGALVAFDSFAAFGPLLSLSLFFPFLAPHRTQSVVGPTTGISPTTGGIVGEETGTFTGRVTGASTGGSVDATKLEQPQNSCRASASGSLAKQFAEGIFPFLPELYMVEHGSCVIPNCCAKSAGNGTNPLGLLMVASGSLSQM